MTRRDLAELFALGALWGAAFLFMRIGVPAFGPAPLVFVRVAGACLLLLPLLAWRGETASLRRHWRAIAVVGVVNSALPFLLFMVAALALSAGLMAILNATAPIWTAMLAWLWLGERLDRSRVTGLVLGVAGVLGLMGHQADWRVGEHGVSAAVGMGACLLACLLYAVAAILSRRHLAGVPPIAVAAGSQLSAAIVMLPAALWAWPEVAPGAAAWSAAAVLAFACTALAYVLYFRLIAHAGATNAISVTFLIPGFAMLWGWLGMGETPGIGTLAGCGVILLGIALATGLLRLPGRT